MSDRNLVIVDYKAGNVRSVQKACEKVGCPAAVSSDPAIIATATHLILPGVGAFKDGMAQLTALGLIPVLTQAVMNEKKPLLGICLGMQLLATTGYENGTSAGLGWIDASVQAFDSDVSAVLHAPLKVPHVGWNNIAIERPSDIFTHTAEVADNSDMYFVHSYHLHTTADIVTSYATYGYRFPASIQQNNIYATQFHPEKSQSVGLNIIKNFVSLDA